MFAKLKTRLTFSRLSVCSLWEVSDEMVQLFPRTWLEGNVFFGHVSDEDGLGAHPSALRDLDLSFSVNLCFLTLLRNTFIKAVVFLRLRV